MQVQLDQITFDFDPERSTREPLKFFRDAEHRTGTYRRKWNQLHF